MGIIAGSTVGSSILLLMLLLALGFFLYRQRKGSEYIHWLFRAAIVRISQCLSLSHPLSLSVVPRRKGAHASCVVLYSNEINEYS